MFLRRIGRPVLFFLQKIKHEREGDEHAKITVNSRNRLYWSYFLDEQGRIRYNKVCRQCAKDCKQSFRATIVCCPFYEKKGVNKA